MKLKELKRALKIQSPRSSIVSEVGFNVKNSAIVMMIDSCY